jgi:hypothetical protein
MSRSLVALELLGRGRGGDQYKTRLASPQTRHRAIYAYMGSGLTPVQTLIDNPSLSFSLARGNS